MKNCFLSLIILLTFSAAINTEAQNFFPLSTGNKYIFRTYYHDVCWPWLSDTTYYQFTITDSIVFNGETYYKFNMGGYPRYLMYDSTEQKLYVLGSQKELAADFNLTNGQFFASYLYIGVMYQSSGRDTTNLFGMDRVKWGMSHDSATAFELDYASFLFAEDIGMYYFLDANFCDYTTQEIYSYTHTLCSAIINDTVFNRIDLSAALITDLYDRTIGEFPLDIEISVNSDLPGLLDSVYLYYEVERDTALIFQHEVAFNPEDLKARINLDSTILQVGDKVNLRVIVTDSTIFENRVTLPDSGYFSINVLADSSIYKLYPLEVGNKWIYDGVFWDQSENYTYKFIRKVNGIVTKPNQLDYYEVEEYQQGSTAHNTYFERLDSLSGYVYRYSEDSVQSNYEYLIDDLNASPGDTIMSCRFLTDFPYTLTGEGDTTIFQIPAHYKTYDSNYLVEYQYTLAQNFGLVSIYNYFDFGYDIKLLKGAIINGTVYGDTTVTAVEEHNQQDLSFSLSQNYPNPFNPSTNLSFVIGQLSFVTLKVYDVLGNEVATLVNEEKPAGSYSVKFDGSNLSSGIYFYKLTADNFIQVKKMLLLK